MSKSAHNTVKLDGCGRLIARSAFSAYEDGDATYLDILRYTELKTHDLPIIREMLLEELR